MNTQQDPQLVVQKIFENVRVEGNITVKNITQIYQNIGNLGDLPQPTGFPQNIPPSNTDKFVGRGKELERLQKELQRNNEVVIAAVEGMGGVGKTELAIQYSLLHLQLDSYPGGICWLTATEHDIGLQIVKFARTDLSLQPPEDLELPQQVRWCWKHWHHWHQGNKLIIVDDVKDYGQIKPFLPPQPSEFKILITTRLKLDLAGSLFLEVLDETAALELLAQLIGSEKLNQELATGKKLCQRLGHLPLGLQLVGRYVQKRRITLAEMLHRLESKGLEHCSLVVNKNDPTWTLNIKRGVAAAFELSWLELNQPAQQLGCLLSLFALAPIPWSLVESTAIGEDSEALENARVELENFHLLQGEDPYRLHQLVREFLRDKQKKLADVDEQKYNFCQAMVEVASEIPELLTPESSAGLDSAMPHLAEVANHFTVYLKDEDLVKYFIGLTWFYKGQGFYNLAVPWYERWLSVTQVRFGPDHPAVAGCLNNLSRLYCSQGFYNRAERLYVQALEIQKRLLGEEHLDVAASLNNLAVLYYSQGRYRDAEPLYVQALALRQRLLGEEHPDVAISLNDLARLYCSQGLYNKAEPLYVQALAICEQRLGVNHPNTVTIRENLKLLCDNR